MKKEFKVNDRVVIYATLAGIPARSKGTVLEVYPNKLYVKMDRVLTTPFIYAHPKQCRRLVKKQRREWWIAMHPCSRPTVHAQYKPDMICGSGCKIEWYRVREVRK